MEVHDKDLLWTIIIGFILSLILSIATGANDSANSFGTSVGSGALTIKQACILGTICELSGAVLLGGQVTDKIRKGIIDTTIYHGQEKLLMLGYIATLLGASTWMFIATYLKVPVSCTHSAVSASVGFSLVLKGLQGIRWSEMGVIVASWIFSPVMSGVFSLAVYLTVEFLIMRRFNPKEVLSKAIPWICALVVFINLFVMLTKGPKIVSELQEWISLLISLFISIIIGFFILIIMKWKTKLPKDTSEVQGPEENLDKIQKRTEADKKFIPLQILTSIFGSFVHAGNDVANSIAPLVSMWTIFHFGSIEAGTLEEFSLMYLLLYGGFGIVIGLWLCGRRVIESVGLKLTTLKPSTGFIIDLGSAATVLLASSFGLPVSTTHCKVGSIVFVGYIDGTMNKTSLVYTDRVVNWKLFGIIFLSWICTIPAAMAFSAFFTWLFKSFI